MATSKRSGRPASLRRAPKGKFFLLAVAGSLLVVGALWAAHAWDGAENVLWQSRVAYFAPRESLDPKIGLILIDSSSLQEMEQDYGYRWPWPRSLYAEIIDFAAQAKSKAVIPTLEFTEPSDVGGTQVDESFAATFDHGTPVVIPLALGAGTEARWPAEFARPQRIEDPERWLSAEVRRADFPVAAIGTRAAELGDVSASPDADKVYRRGRLVRRFDGGFVPSLGLAAFLTAGASASVTPGFLHIGERRIPIDHAGDAVLRFRNRPDSSRVWTAAQILRSAEDMREGKPPLISPQALAGRYLFLGLAETGVAFATPTAEAMSAAEFHATVLDNLLTSSFMRPASMAEKALLLVLFASLGAGIALLPSRAWLGILGAMTVAAGAIGLGYLAYARGMWLPVAPIAASTLVAGVAMGSLQHSWESRSRAHLDNAFRHYVPPQVIDQMLDDPSLLRLGGERRTLTVLFSDIEGFTSLSERNDPSQVVAFLNQFLEDMGNIIIGRGGTIDKYVGDAIVAFWNAPLDCPDHAARAVLAALDCQQLLAKRQQAYRDLLPETIRMRIGLCTGQAVVGNLGSAHRFNYTAIGDCVNTASRLEGANKAIGSTILASEATRAAGGAACFREVGDLKLDGKEQPMRVFQALPGKPSERELEVFARGLAAWRMGEMAAAQKLFEELPADPVAVRYADRSRRAMAGAESVLSIHKD